MDSGTVKTFTDAAAHLLPALVQLTTIEATQRTPEDNSMVRQLRLATGAIAHALMETPRAPPPMPQIAPPPNVGAAS